MNFDSFGYVIQDWRGGEMIGTGSKRGGTFLFDVGSRSSFFAATTILNRMWTIWHWHLGHLHNDKLVFLFKHGLLDSSVDNKLLGSFLHSKCSSCCLSKSNVLPFPVSYSQASAPFHIIHSDVWGIAPNSS